MFYRYEALNETGDYEGIFCFLNPSERRYFSRYVKEPKWYKKNPYKVTRCWFTEEGYEKCHHIIEELIADKNLTIRILTKDKLNNIVCKGKIQCIELVTEKYMKRKVLFKNGKNGACQIIITDAPKEVIEKWCERYHKEYFCEPFDTIKTLYYVKELFDSKYDEYEDDINVIGYDEIYDYQNY